MELFVAGRQTGKTFWMLEWMRRARPGELRVCICASRRDAARLYQSTLDVNGEPTYWQKYQFISADEVRTTDKFRSRQHVVFGIDNIDLILPTLLGGSIGIATGTNIRVHDTIPTFSMLLDNLWEVSRDTDTRGTDR